MIFLRSLRIPRTSTGIMPRTTGMRKVGNVHGHGRDQDLNHLRMGSIYFSKKSFFSTDIGGGKSMGGRLIAWYTTKLETHPYTTKCITSGMIAGLGNVTCQCLEQKGGRKDEKKNDNENANAPSSSVIIEWDRAARFFVLGFALIAPTVHVWYGFLMRQIPGVTLSKVVQRTALDQFFFSPIFLPTFMTSLMLLEEGPDLIMNDVKRKEMSEVLCRDLPDVLVTNWGIWTPAMLINFRFVPAKFQVLYSNMVGFIWNVYLSWKLHRDNTDDHLDKQH